MLDKVSDGEKVQVRVTKDQKKRYLEAARIIGMPFADWVRDELDKAADILKRLRVTPEQLRLHQARQRPMDPEGLRLQDEELANEHALPDEVADEDGLAGCFDEEYEIRDRFDSEADYRDL